MHAIKKMTARVRQGPLRCCPLRQQRAGVKFRTVQTNLDIHKQKDEESKKWPRRIFSGIQPTGTLHLGNYLGAVQKWIHLQNINENATYCIVDMHSITLPQDPYELRQSTFQMAATLLACGLNPEKSTLFVQSAVREHAELCWILSCFSTMARLGHLPQYKEKTRTMKDIPLGLFVYPVLQAADIMAYKTTHVPVGEDQVQHIQLAQHLAKTFNSKFGETFPVCEAIIDHSDAKRIRSLRDPSKKMSKSDPDTRATISILDEPDVIVDKIKKAVTDFTSDVSYDPNTRLGVSNLVAIHSLVSGKPIAGIVEESRDLDTGRYKNLVAEAVVEHLKPIRIKVTHHMVQPGELIYLLEAGAARARKVAQETLADVHQKMGLGAQHVPVLPVSQLLDEPKAIDVKSSPAPEMHSVGGIDVPVVPKQQLRVEKRMNKKMEILVEIKKASSSPIKKFDLLPIPVVSAEAKPATEIRFEAHTVEKCTELKPACITLKSEDTKVTDVIPIETDEAKN